MKQLIAIFSGNLIFWLFVVAFLMRHKYETDNMDILMWLFFTILSTIAIWGLFF